MRQSLLPVLACTVEGCYMASDDWIKTLGDGRRVKFTNEKLVGSGTFMTVEGSEVVYSVLLESEINPLNREQVESRFESELGKK